MKYNAGDRLRVEIELDDITASIMNDEPLKLLFGCPVISHEPAPFSWDDVKPGMAFKHEFRGNDICHYIGKSLWYDHCVIMAIKKHDVAAPDCTHCDMKFLTRAPEHDIEVK
jgi:hypothetical protein